MVRGLSTLMLALLLGALIPACKDSDDDDPPPAAPAVVLFGANGAGGNLSNLFTLDAETGATLSTIGPIGFSVTGMAQHPGTGVLYGCTSAQDPANPGSLITIDKATGAGTLVGDIVASSTTGPADITFTSDGTLYGWSEASDDLVTINLTTGAGTEVADSTLDTFGSGLSVSQDGVMLLAGDGDGGDLTTIDRATGLATGTVTMDGTLGGSVGALAFRDNNLYGVRIDTGSANRETVLVRIDTTTGAMTILGASVDRLDAIAFGNP